MDDTRACESSGSILLEVEEERADGGGAAVRIRVHGERRQQRALALRCNRLELRGVVAEVAEDPGGATGACMWGECSLKTGGRHEDAILSNVHVSGVLADSSGGRYAPLESWRQRVARVKSSPSNVVTTESRTSLTRNMSRTAVIVSTLSPSGASKIRLRGLPPTPRRGRR